MTDKFGRPAANLARAVQPGERLALLDALRGLALLGVLAINLESEFRVSIFAQFLPGRPESGPDRWVNAALDLLVEMKAFALFSLLFGVGLAIQHERLAASGRSAVLLVRRLVVLLAFGLVHLFLIWNGDILTEYALAGLVVLPFLFGPTWVIAAGSVLFLGFYVLSPLWPPIIAFPDRAWLAAQVAAADRVYATGTFAEILAFRVRESAAILPLHVAVFPRTLGLFLLGVFAWRVGLVRNARRLAGYLWSGGALAAGIGLVLALATSGRAPAGWPSLGRIGLVAEPAGTILLALGYAASVLALETGRTGRAWLRWAEPVGRMAFTNYIVQSLVLGFVFYGYGLGLFGKLGSTVGLAIVLGLYGVQVVASAAWLASFRFGPLEWVWRALMYGRAPPLRR